MLDFLQNLDNDIRDALLAQLRNLWTHTSTAIEGNTLTLGETAFVLEEGLTISGKPLKDHEEVVGHARAIDLVYDFIRRKSDLTEKDLFDLHKAVQAERIIDVYKPVGAWKVEPNSTVIVSGDTQTIFEFAAPKDVPELMQSWITLFKKTCKENRTNKESASEYHLAVGNITSQNELLPDVEKLNRFKRFCTKSWTESIKLVDSARKQQQERNQ